MQDAVIRQIEIMGEAAKHLSKGFRDSNQLIPWQDITGMRDKPIHGYFGVDIEKVWITVQQDIPVLLEDISVLLTQQP